MDKKVSTRVGDYSARRGNWCERHLSIFSTQFLAAHTLTPFRQLNQTAKVFLLKLSYHHPTPVVEKSCIFTNSTSVFLQSWKCGKIPIWS